jgi:hypothetical protein
VIFPATYDIAIFQNATWNAEFRALNDDLELAGITVTSGTPTFNACHKFAVGDKVVFTGGTKTPCGLELNKVYFVIAAGLTTNEFQVSETSGGSSISVEDEASGTFYVSRPINLTGYTIDSDVKKISGDRAIVSFSFTPSITNAVDGLFTLSLAPSVTEPLPLGDYQYDVSLTSSGGTRYYLIKGVATVQPTYSRN